MQINFDSIKSELLLEDNFKSLIASLEFFITIDFKDTLLSDKKDIENISLVSIIERLEKNNFDFDLTETALMIKALENAHMFKLQDFKSLTFNPDFNPPDDICLSCVQELLQLLQRNLNDNGFDYKARHVDPT